MTAQTGTTAHLAEREKQMQQAEEILGSLPQQSGVALLAGQNPAAPHVAPQTPPWQVSP